MKKSMNLVIWVLAIILVIVAASVFYSKYKLLNEAKQQDVITTTQIADTDKPTQTDDADKSSGKEMAPDFILKDLNDKSVKLSDYRGKIVILNFWAVWCKYCKIEMPELNELNKIITKDNDVVLLAIDVQESTTTVKSYLDSNNISLNVLMDSDGAVAQNYGITGYPTTFVVNRDGSVYTKISGATDKKTLQDIIDKVK